MTLLLQITGWALWVLAGPVAIASAYMLLVVVGSWCYRRKTEDDERLLRITVVVPAHNEQAGIAATVQDLIAADYPRDRFEVVVLADNCTDRTADTARLAGARVVERNDPGRRGKGQALDWVLQEHSHLFDGVDLIAFVDADMRVDAHFLPAMAAAFMDPRVDVAQGRYVVANPSDSVLAAMGYASFCYVNHIRPAGRSFWGGTADIKGSGMVFRKEHLLARGWGAHSIAEDAQLGRELMLEGVRVLYVPDARVISDIPSTLSQVRIQQTRWEAGKRDVYTGTFPRLLRAIRRRPSMLLLDGLFDMLIPPLSLVVLLNLLALSVAWAVGSPTAWIFLASLLVFGAATISGLVQNRAPPRMLWRLAAAPAFVLWKAALLVRLLLGARPSGWHRTPRDPR